MKKPTKKFKRPIVCLPSPDDNERPNTMLRGMLFNAGLGQELEVDENGDSKTLQEVIFGLFPKLANCGGFEILSATGNSKSLNVIPIPNNGYSVKYIRDCVRSGCLYIRPLQTALDTSPVSGNEGIWLEKCVLCGTEMPLNQIRSHRLTCLGDASDQQLAASNYESSTVTLNEGLEIRNDTEVLEEFTFQNSASELQESELALKYNCQDESFHNNLEELSSVMAAFQISTINLDRKTRIVVDRDDLWNSFLNECERLNFKFSTALNVTFINEEAADFGGPTREFLSLASRKLIEDSGVFVGEPGDVLFSKNFLLYPQGYTFAGKFVAYCVALGEPFPVFNDLLFRMMFNCKHCCSFQINDRDTIQRIKKVQAVTSEAEMEEFKTEQLEFFTRNGYPKIFGATLQDKEEIENFLLTFHIYYRTSGEISQFIDGMNSVGNLADIIKQNSDVFHKVFVQAVKPSFKNIMDIIEIKYSSESNNLRHEEEITVESWKQFLKDLDSPNSTLRNQGITFEKVLTFITASDKLPVKGFQDGITIEFYSQLPGIIRRPYAYTCPRTVYLPRGSTNISELMQESIDNHKGFGRR